MWAWGGSVVCFVVFFHLAANAESAAGEPPRTTLVDSVPGDDIPPVHQTDHRPRRGHALTILAGSAAVGVFTPSDNYSELGALVSGRFGWFVGDRFVLDGAATYWRTKERDTSGIEGGVGLETFIAGRVPARLELGLGRIGAPSVTKNFAASLAVEIQYEFVSTPRFAVALGGRLHGLSSDLDQGDADPLMGTGSAFGANLFVALRVFGSRRFKYARFR